jgi:hypothetical protein
MSELVFIAEDREIVEVGIRVTFPVSKLGILKTSGFRSGATERALRSTV